MRKDREKAEKGRETIDTRERNDRESIKREREER